MNTRIKVCCISSVDEARLAVRYGAAALGLVSAMPSGPGVIDEALIAKIAASAPPAVATFLLTSLQDADAIRQVRPFGVDLCSSLRTDGQLDEAKVADFVKAAREA